MNFKMRLLLNLVGTAFLFSRIMFENRWLALAATICFALPWLRDFSVWLDAWQKKRAREVRFLTYAETLKKKEKEGKL